MEFLVVGLLYSTTAKAGLLTRIFNQWVVSTISSATFTLSPLLQELKNKTNICNLIRRLPSKRIII